MGSSIIETKRHSVPYVIEQSWGRSSYTSIRFKKKLWAHGHGSPEMPPTIHGHQIKFLDVDPPIIPSVNRLEIDGGKDIRSVPSPTTLNAPDATSSLNNGTCTPQPTALQNGKIFP